MTYIEFLKSKIERTPVSGFEADPAELSPALKPHQRDAVPPPFAAALVRANLPEWCGGVTLTSMAGLKSAVAV